MARAGVFLVEGDEGRAADHLWSMHGAIAVYFLVAPCDSFMPILQLGKPQTKVSEGVLRASGRGGI